MTIATSNWIIANKYLTLLDQIVLKMKKKNTTELTRAEMELMQIIWELKECFLGEIVEAYPEPKPAYTTIASTINVLETKGFITHHTWNRSHQYYAILQKEEYAQRVVRQTLTRFFDNSPSQMLSFLNDSGTLSSAEYEDLKRVAAQILKLNQ